MSSHDEAINKALKAEGKRVDKVMGGKKKFDMGAKYKEYQKASKEAKTEALHKAKKGKK